MEQEIQLNEHNKQEYPPMHTAEHLLNSQMVKYFHCERSFSAHIEKKKSKCDYHFKTAPSAEDIATVEQAVNDIIQQTYPVRFSRSVMRDVIRLRWHFLPRQLHRRHPRS